MSLHYLALTPAAKQQIWIAFLKKAQKLEDTEMRLAGLTDRELQELGEKNVNGRQIKNIVRTATALASSEDQEVGYKHIAQVFDIMERSNY